MMITADNHNTAFFSSTRVDPGSVPAYKSFLHRTRFLLLSLVVLLNSVVYSNSILINFVVICMSDDSVELKLNGSTVDYDVIRKAVYTSMHDFRSVWFTYTSVQQSILFSMAPIGSLLMLYPNWLLIQNFGYRRVCSLNTLLSTLLTAFLPWTIYFGLPYLLAAQFLLGASASAAFLLVPSVIRKWSTRKNDHFCFLVLLSFQQLSPSITYPIAALLCELSLGWPIVFYVQSIFSLLVTFVFFYFYKETPDRHANVSDYELETIQRADVITGDIDYKRMLKCVQFQSVSFSIFVHFLVVSFFIQYLPLYLHKILDVPLNLTSWIITAIMLCHIFFKLGISRIFEKYPKLTNIYSIKFVSLASFAGPAIFFITLFFTRFDFYCQSIFLLAIFAFLSLSWPSIFKSSYIISNKYYLPVMIRIQIALFFLASIASNIPLLAIGSNDSWFHWRYSLLVLTVLLLTASFYFWITFRFEKSDWDIAIPEDPEEPVRAEDIAPVSHPRPCQFSASFDGEIIVSVTTLGLDKCGSCDRHKIRRIHPISEATFTPPIPTRQQFDELTQEASDTIITRF